MATLVFRDETLTGDILHEGVFQVEGERITLKELIALRVRQEVEAYNSNQEVSKSLVEPTHAEKTLNGSRVKKGREVDAEQQIYIAYDAFLKNGFLVLIDNEQAEELEQEILIKPAMTVSFLKLTPLVGG